MTENNNDTEKSVEVVGRYGKEYSRLRRLTSNLDVIQQSVGIIFLPKKIFFWTLAKGPLVTQKTVLLQKTFSQAKQFSTKFFIKHLLLALDRLIFEKIEVEA